MSDRRKTLCVIFDIDETLIHFVKKIYRHLWDDLNPEIKQKFRVYDDGKNVIILRPHIQNLFNYFKKTPEIKVALWTYGEKEYSETIATILKTELNLPEDFFLFTWGAEDMDGSSEGLSKDLTQVYEAFPNFNKFNTFIVDDLYKNIKHHVNQENCILIEPFAPFGTSKKRTSINDNIQIQMSRDNAFNVLKNVCVKVLKDIMGCDPEDIDGSFYTESVFGEKRVKRMGLLEHLKTYAVKFVKMLTIGNPMEVKEFIMVDPEQYQVHVKGGKKTRHASKKTNKRKTRRHRRI
jgi:hypothetical protein